MNIPPDDHTQLVARIENIENLVNALIKGTFGNEEALLDYVKLDEINPPPRVVVRVQGSLTELNKHSVYPGEPPGFRQKDHYPT